MQKKVKSIQPESRGLKDSREIVKPIPNLPRIVHIFAFDGDYPRQALRLDLAYRIDRMILKYLWDRYSVCQFKNTTAYNKGRRMVGLHRELRRSRRKDAYGNLTGVRIGRFQGLVEPLGYRKTPLSEVDQKRVRLEYQQGSSIKKLVDDWDVSETYIRGILKEDKPPVSPLGKPINKGVLVPEPPDPSRVAKVRGVRPDDQ